MIAIGATAEKPPTSSLPIGILVCGALTMLVTLLGVWGVISPSRRVFAIFSSLEFCMIIYQLGLMITMYLDAGTHINIKDPKARAQFNKVITRGRGAFVAFIIFQVKTPPLSVLF